MLGGLWLVIAPFTLLYFNTKAPFYNDIVVGVLTILLTGYCSYMINQPNTRQSRLVAGWLTVVAGGWLIITPFILNYSGTSNVLWNDIIKGVLIVAISLYAMLYHRTHNTGDF